MARSAGHGGRVYAYTDLGLAYRKYHCEHAPQCIQSTVLPRTCNSARAKPWMIRHDGEMELQSCLSFTLAGWGFFFLRCFYFHSSCLSGHVDFLLCASPQPRPHNGESSKGLSDHLCQSPVVSRGSQSGRCRRYRTPMEGYLFPPLSSLPFVCLTLPC